MRTKLGIALIYLAAVLILIAVLATFDVITLGHSYTIAAVGFACYIAGTFFMREGKLTAYRFIMIIVGALLVLFAIFREFTS